MKQMKIAKEKPLYGFGTHRLKGDVCYKSVLLALKKGYNLIDTAEKYENSIQIGNAIRKSHRRRDSFKIIHKLTDVAEFDRSKEETFNKVDRFLSELGTSYIDILLMHGPAPRYHEHPEIFMEGNIRVWEAMYELKQNQILKSIGVSNFNKQQIMYLIEATGIIPEYLEVEYNVLNYKQVEELKKWTDRMGIQIIGYSPLAAGNISMLGDIDEYEEYVQNHPISSTEYALRFCLSNDVIPIPRSSNPKRIKENLKNLKKGKL